MKNLSKTNIKLIGPEDQCTPLTIDLFVHTYGPSLKNHRKRIYLDKCVKSYETETPKFKRKIMAAELNNIKNYRGINIVTELEIFKFTKAFPDIFFTLEQINNRIQTNKYYMDGIELFIDEDDKLFANKIIDNWDIICPDFDATISAPYPVVTTIF